MSKQITEQLNKLRTEIRPDAAWQARSRDILLMQIKQGAAEKEAQWFTFIESRSVQQFLVQLTRPLSMAFVLLLAVLGGGVMSIKAATQTKPGDALYIAKIISEKTQFALTFDNAKKAKLNLAFAANRVEEIKQLNNDRAAGNANDQKVSELTNEIKDELDQAKSRISKIEAVEPAVAPVKKEVAKAGVQADVKLTVESASLNKGAEGIDYYDPRQAAIEQVKTLIEQRDYDATSDKIRQLSSAIEEPQKLGEKGTSTEENKNTDTSPTNSTSTTK